MSARDLFALEDFEDGMDGSNEADISEAPEEELASVTEADMIENKIEVRSFPVGGTSSLAITKNRVMLCAESSMSFLRIRKL